MERTKKKKKELLTSHYVIGAPWFKYLCSIFLFLFWYVCDLFYQLLGLGFLDRLINKQIHICTVQALQSTVICRLNQNVHIWLCIRKTLLSVNQVSAHTRPEFFPSYHLFAGKIHIAHFQFVLNHDLSKQQRKVSEVTIQEVWRGDTTHHTHSIYVYIYVVYTYILLSRTEL